MHAEDCTFKLIHNFFLQQLCTVHLVIENIARIANAVQVYLGLSIKEPVKNVLADFAR